MSSRRRRSREKGEQADAFSPGSDGTNNTDLEDFANLLYSTGEVGEELRRLDNKPSRIKMLPIEKIFPDPTQARRVMPIVLRSKWIMRHATVVEVLNSWLERADEEARGLGREAIDVPTLLTSDPENQDALPEDEKKETLPDMGPIETSFRAMVSLAASIRHHGLANPITVVGLQDGTYQLETGERRLLAYNLLHSLPQYVDEQSYDVIPCRVVEEKSIWRQAAENGARQDLNAVSVARQLALLLMDIYKNDYGFLPPKNMPSQEWYAQVYDSKRFPVPYGRGAEMAAALGLKSGNQIRQYRQLLDLPPGVWQLADELNWSEYKVRKMRTQAKKIDESVTAVTEADALVTIANYEAGLLEGLPHLYEHVLGIKRYERDNSPSGKATRRHNLLANSVGCRVEDVDESDGTLYLRLEDPDVLAKLEKGFRIVISVRLDN